MRSSLTKPANVLPFWPDPEPTVSCPYCSGRGHVYAGAWDPPRRCLACEGSGRRPPLPCPLCAEPLLDDQSKVYSIDGRSVAVDNRPVHLDCLPEEGAR